jgi:hypothetical protein
MPNQKKCGHKYACGCRKSVCKECRDQLKEDKVPKEEWADTIGLSCENDCCKLYYSFRNDNCNCDDSHCQYCSEREYEIFQEGEDEYGKIIDERSLYMKKKDETEDEFRERNRKGVEAYNARVNAVLAKYL